MLTPILKHNVHALFVYTHFTSIFTYMFKPVLTTTFTCLQLYVHPCLSISMFKAMFTATLHQLYFSIIFTHIFSHKLVSSQEQSQTRLSQDESIFCSHFIPILAISQILNLDNYLHLKQLQPHRNIILFQFIICILIILGFPINKLQARVLHLHVYDYDRFEQIAG